MSLAAKWRLGELFCAVGAAGLNIGTVRKIGSALAALCSCGERLPNHVLSCRPSSKMTH